MVNCKNDTHISIDNINEEKISMVNCKNVSHISIDNTSEEEISLTPMAILNGTDSEDSNGTDSEPTDSSGTDSDPNGNESDGTPKGSITLSAPSTGTKVSWNKDDHRLCERLMEKWKQHKTKRPRCEVLAYERAHDRLEAAGHPAYQFT